MHEEITVTGMHCPSCEKRVNLAVGDIEGVSAVVSNHEADIVVVDYDAPATHDAIVAAIIEEGFVVE